MANELPDFKKIGRDLIRDAQTIAEVEMINFIMSNFERQGFDDNGLKPWQKRKNDADPGRAVLIQSASLRDSVKISKSTPQQVVASSDARHAEIHNEGGTVNIPVTSKMRKFFWYMHKKTMDDKWKGMALTKKKAFTFEMPERRFMGPSATFDSKIENLFIKSITHRFKMHLNSK